MSKFNLNKAFVVSYTLIIVFTIIGFALLFYFNIFKRKQSNMIDSYNKGYGYYSDPFHGPCLTQSGKCDDRATKKITKKCIPHPVTGKGCLLKDGTMSYDDLMETRPCKKQCIGSAFEVSDGLQFKEVVDSNNVPYTILLGSGGNQIVNQFGLNVTDEFLDDFDSKENKYTVKKCFDSNEYPVYSISNYNCSKFDSDKASNNCVFTCGVNDKNAIRENIIRDSQLNITIPDYPKINGRYICHDKFNNNQIEVFNTGNIPSDFVYPNQCYDHYINEGTSFSKNLINTVNINQTYFTLLNESLPEYNLFYDYNDYYPLRISNQFTMVEKIKNFNNYVSQSEITAGYVYLDFEINLNNTTSFFNTSSKNTVIIVEGTDTKIVEISLLENNSIIGINLNEFLDDTTVSFSDYYYENNTMYLNYSNFTPVIGDYIYFKINSFDIDHESSFAKITSVDSGTSSFGLSVLSLSDKAYQYKIKFWDTNKFFEGTIGALNSLKNLIDNNKYFLSDLSLPTSNFVGSQSGSLFKVYHDTIPDSQKFYIYSETNNFFYYPVSRTNINGNSKKLTIPDYPGFDFYLLEGGIEEIIYPPSKFLNLPSFEDTNSYVEVETVSNSYGTFVNYIKQIILLSSSILEGDLNLYSITLSNNSKYLITNFIANTINNTLVKKISNFVKNTSDTTDENGDPYIEKIKLYNDIFVTQNYNFNNQYGVSFLFTIENLKSTVLTADYSVFRTPNICFNEFNLPLQSGSTIQLQPGENVTFNIKNILNSDDHNCGFFGASLGVFEVQDRINYKPSLGLSSLISSENNYENYLNFLDPGYELTDLYCFKNINGLIKDDSLCRKPFITRNFSLTGYYNPEEELLKEFKNSNLFYSTINNNSGSPNINNTWNLIKKYNSKENANIDENFYSQRNGTYFTFSCQNNGITGEDLSKLAVYYLYNKQNSIYQTNSPNVLNPNYYLFKDYYQNNITRNTNTFLYNEQPKEIMDSYPNNFIYDIGITIGGSGAGVSLYNVEYSINVNNDFQVGDFISPDFNLFNSALIEDGISVFGSTNTNYFKDNFENLNNFSFSNLNINNNIAVNDLIFLAYDNQLNFYDNNILDEDIYNYSFEVCRVLDFSIADNTVQLERNLLNYPRENLFYGISVPLTAYKFSSNFNSNLLFPITNIFNNQVFFSVPIYINNLNNDTNTNILKNYQSRTALSLRIIKKEVEIPNSNIIDNYKLYLLSSLEEKPLTSYLDIITKKPLTTENFFGYYLNEFKEDRYNSNNQKTNFNIGDTITVNIDNLSYDLTILETKVLYIGIMYDYYCESSENINITSLVYNHYISYFYFLNNTTPTSTNEITETINYQHKDEIDVTDNNFDIQINPIEYKYSSLFYQGVSDVITNSYLVNNFLNLTSNQVNVDKNIQDTSRLPTLTLKTTKVYNDLNDLSSFLEISNITTNGKPYGPSYLTNLVSSNDLNLNSYSVITSFDIIGNFILTTLNSNLILSTLNGIRFGITQGDIASFNFINSFRAPVKNYSFNETYQENDTVNYNYNSNLIYRNTNNIISQFNEDGQSDFNQPYYIYSDNLYKYPLFLKEITGGNSLQVSGLEGVSLWYDASDFNQNTEIPNIKIYKEFTNTNLTANSVWKQTGYNIYPLTNLQQYNSSDYYSSGDFIEYENNVYVSLINNYNNTPNNLGISWKFYDGYTDLYNNKGYFFNINTGVSTNPENLNLVTKLNTQNYPFAVVDYNTNKNYGINPNSKAILNYQDKFSDFLNLSLFDLSKSILGKIILFNDSSKNSYATLAASPCSKDDLNTGYRFFKQFSPYQSGEAISQYIYDLNLPTQENSGKPFCLGNTKFNPGVSSYEFANTISFLPVPLNLESQDYPFTIYEGSSICKLTPNSIFSYPGTSTINTIIESSDGSYSYKTINFKKSFFTTININNTKFEPGSGTIYNSLDNIVGSYDTDPGVSLFSVTFSNFNDKSSALYSNNQIFENDVAFYKTFLNEDSVSIDNFKVKDFLVLKTKTPNSFGVSFGVFDVPKNISITSPNTLTADYYDLIPNNRFNLQAWLDFDANNNLINFDEIYITNNDLNIGDKIYFLTPGYENDLKIKLYGFFQNQFLSPIVYQTTDILNNINNSTINLVFSPFKNQLLNAYNEGIELITSSGTSVIVKNYQYNEMNDIFILGNNNSSLDLKPVYSKEKLFTSTGEINENNIFIFNPGVSQFSLVDSESVTNLIPTNFDINNYTVLGGISDVIPINNNNDSTSQYYRESKGALNTNISFLTDCSIYQISSNGNNYTAGDTVNSYINNKGLFNIQVSGLSINPTTLKVTSNTSYTKTVPNSPYNTATYFFQDDPTNINFPIYFSRKSGDDFKNNLLFGTSNGTSTDVIIKYYMNLQEVENTTYYDLTKFNTALNRNISIVLTKNNFFDPLPDQVIYVGTSAYQFTNGISTLLYGGLSVVN